MVRLSKRKALVPKTTARRIVRPGGEQLTASLSIRRSGGPVAGTFSGGGFQTILRKRVPIASPATGCNNRDIGAVSGRE